MPTFQTTLEYMDFSMIFIGAKDIVTLVPKDFEKNIFENVTPKFDFTFADFSALERFLRWNWAHGQHFWYETRWPKNFSKIR